MKSAKETRREYAMKKIEQYRAQGIENPVIVLPVVIDEDGVAVITNETGLVGKNAEWCAVNVVSSNRVFRSGFMSEAYTSALIRMRVVNNTFRPGDCLKGKIYTVESLTPTNPGNIQQDVKYLNADLRDALIPCTVGGQQIYQQHFYTENMSEPDVLIQHDNGDVLAAKAAELRANSNRPNSQGIQNAAKKQARLAELQAIPKTKRTAAEKEELMELMEA